MNTAAIGIIGGSGLYDLPDTRIIEEKKVRTPFGNTSDAITIAEIGGIRTAFLPRHGRGHYLSPTEIPNRANIFALKSIGVDKIIAISAVGSLREEIPPEHFIIPDQIIDRTKTRDASFFSDGIVGHVGFSDPFCSDLSALISRPLGESLGNKLHMGGTYVCMEGPAFSTRAESHLYRNWGASIIGMTAVPEAKLAREAEICYSLIAMCTDYDCWREGEDAVTVDMIIAHMERNTQAIKSLLPAMVASAAKHDECPHHQAAQYAIITGRDRISKQARKRLTPLYGKYW